MLTVTDDRKGKHACHTKVSTKHSLMAEVTVELM